VNWFDKTINSDIDIFFEELGNLAESLGYGPRGVKSEFLEFAINAYLGLKQGKEARLCLMAEEALEHAEHRTQPPEVLKLRLIAQKAYSKAGAKQSASKLAAETRELFPPDYSDCFAPSLTRPFRRMPF
jgi:hypothetical protein